MRGAAAVLAGAALALAAPRAHAEPEALARAEAAYASLDYRTSATAAEEALGARGLSHDELVRATRALALARAALGQEAAAREAFVQLLAYDPEYKVDAKLGPRVTAPFQEARGFWAAQSERAGVAGEVLGDRGSYVVRARLRDPLRRARALVVGYRWAATTPFTRRTETAGAAVTVDVGAAPAGATSLEWFVEARDERDAAVYVAGTSDAPARFMLPARDEPPPAPTASHPAPPLALAPSPVEREGRSVWASPWLWAGAGAAVAVGVVAAVVAASSSGPAGPATARVVPVAYCGPTPCP